VDRKREQKLETFNISGLLAVVMSQLCHNGICHNCANNYRSQWSCCSTLACSARDPRIEPIL